MTAKYKLLFRRIAMSLCGFILLIVVFTLYANICVERAAAPRTYSDVDSIPRNKVALLLGTNPLNRLGRPNTYFTNRINAAAELFHAGKVDFIIASGDNHTRQYDEPTAMRDSLIVRGVPASRIILDFAGFRTLDSVVRAKEVFGCDSVTIISQVDHCARSLYLAAAAGLEAVAFSAPVHAGRWVRVRLTLREWLARDKMMIDIMLGKKPHFLGERIKIPEISALRSRSTGEMESRLKSYIEGKDSKIGVAVIIDGRDTVAVNGNRDFPMLSVYKFPEALAVAEICGRRKFPLDGNVSISASEILTDTWSPMREKYGVKNLSQPLSELLGYSLQQSDNNACDILFRLIGGTQVADSLMKAKGFGGISINYTEEEMHADVSLCYRNSSTPVEMARLFDFFYRGGMCRSSEIHEAIGRMMISCETGARRLPAPLMSTNAIIGHKTGTGDKNSNGRIIGVNDAGYVFLPDGSGYAVAVFISDSAYSMEQTEAMIGEISEIIYESLVFC